MFVIGNVVAEHKFRVKHAHRSHHLHRVAERRLLQCVQNASRVSQAGHLDDEPRWPGTSKKRGDRCLCHTCSTAAHAPSCKLLDDNFAAAAAAAAALLIRISRRRECRAVDAHGTHLVHKNGPLFAWWFVREQCLHDSALACAEQTRHQRDGDGHGDARYERVVGCG